MKRTLGIILAATAAAGLYWRDGLVAVTTPYVSSAFAAVSATATPVAPGNGKAAPATSGNRRGAAPTRVATVAATAEDMPIERRTIGAIASPANLTVTTETSGLVTDILVADGADVKAGDVLVRLDSRIAEATVEKDRAALARDQATLDHARETAARQQKLLSNEAVSQQSLEDADAAVKTAEATVAVDQASLKSDLVTLDQKTIRAPFDGRLGAVGVVEGSLVQPGTAIVRLTRLDPLYASFALSESDAALVRSARAAGKPIEVSVTPLGATDAFTGTVDFVDDAVDAASGTFLARATLHGVADRLVPGQSIAVEAAIGSMPVVAVPTVALQATQQGSIVYVVGADGTVAAKPVTVALSVGDRSGLSSGINAGDRVVVEGQVRLADGMKVIDTSADAANGKPGAGKPTSTAEAQ
ncbi:efflux RND transporter periplasmic adaptor subunit [Pleomorphomonas sp. NRK KF1]|uniref:efflux RND transporter periplasmic adaptor subunit n=1 Tax=Pleomorphomonas sp. NRK KF1 TaxID=2943000 RepID=UPI0020431CCE|nr:efflux RND transporter periplasmic adaptor subunit [Pleomorphomonas sp. NRK KF1]MCM5555201.1 efflux RND transporter periplasmic adaptor subunit [Pleomorphomonas sp. NRK KF1]